MEAWTRNLGREWIGEMGVVQMAITLLPYVGNMWIKCGSKGMVRLGISPLPPSFNSSTLPTSTTSKKNRGLVHALPEDMGYLIIHHYEALRIPEEEVVSTTGAGDTLVGGLVAGLLSGQPEVVWVGKALEQVGRTMRSDRAVG